MDRAVRVTQDWIEVLERRNLPPADPREPPLIPDYERVFARKLVWDEGVSSFVIGD